ncbi:MAG: aryl-sulfate sulfotransferase [Myxococcota bacterium]|nr:aryl-sulfate sulfotransferase [Myxococcota bacterium]
MLIYLLSCQPSTPISTEIHNDSASPIVVEEDASEEENLIISSLLYLNRSGRLFIYDRILEEEIWTLSNPEDPVWLDAHLSPDGNHIYHNVVDVRDHNPSLSEIRKIDFEGNIVSRTPTPWAHHAFDLVGEELVSIVTEFRQHAEHGKVAGDRIVLYRDGQEETILSTFSILNPMPLTPMWDFGHFEDAHDWTHANAIRWYEEVELFLITLPGINAVWSFGMDGYIDTVYLGKGMQKEPYLNGIQYQERPFSIYEGGSFDMPHGATLDRDGTMWVLSNGLGGQTPSFAEGYVIENDALVLKHQLSPPVENAHSAGLGSVLRLDSSPNVIINWGIYGLIEEKAPNTEETIWQVESNLQEVYGFSNVLR